MEVLVSIVFVLTMLGFATRNAMARGSWKAAAQELDLIRTHNDSGLRELRGSSGGVATSVTHAPNGMVIEIRGETKLDAGVRLSKQSFFRGPASAEQRIGEPKFDKNYYLEGSDDAVAAMLTSAAREAMQDLARHSTPTLTTDGGRGLIDGLVSFRNCC